MPPYNVKKHWYWAQGPERTDVFPVTVIRELAAGIAATFMTEYREDVRRASDRLAYDAFVEHELPYPKGGAETAKLLCFECAYTTSLDHDSALSLLEVRLMELSEAAAQDAHLDENVVVLEIKTADATSTIPPAVQAEFVDKSPKRTNQRKRLRL